MELEIKIDARKLNILPATEEEEIMQNVLMILLTPKYSVPLDRAFGLEASIIDAPINHQAQLTAQIALAIRQFEPRARLKKVNFGGDMSNGQIVPSVVIELVEKNLRGDTQ